MFAGVLNALELEGVLSALLIGAAELDAGDELLALL